MSPDAQRIAIAEACGWKWGVAYNSRVTRFIAPEGFKPTGTWRPAGEATHIDWPNHGKTIEEIRLHLIDALPDYLNDLNAMHEAEKVLTSSQCCQYATHIRSIHSNPGLLRFDIMHATAAQRAEAFLRTIGKWDDSL